MKISKDMAPAFISSRLSGGRDVAKVAAVAMAIFAAIVAIRYVVNRFNVVKTETNGPLGFENYGLSCWAGAMMQGLLACKKFEDIARSPLKKTNALHLVKNENYYEREVREDTNEEFEKRVDAQNALIELFDARKRGNRGELRDALKTLHEKMTHINLYTFSPPPCLADPGYFLNALVTTLGYPDSIWRCNFSDELFKHIFSIDDLKERRYGLCSTPQIIVTIDRQPEGPFDVNQTLDLSSCFENGGKYRVVAVLKETPGHNLAYVRSKEKWFCCNDDKVQEVQMEAVELNRWKDNLVLELCS